MAFPNFVISILIVSLSFVDYCQTKEDFYDEILFKLFNDFDLTGEEVLNNIKIFKPEKIKNVDEFLNASKIAIGKFEEVLGAKINETLKKKLYDTYKQFAKKFVAAKDLMFLSNTKAIRRTLLDAQVFSQTTDDLLVKMYYDEIEEANDSVSFNDTVLNTFPAVTSADARFLRCLGFAKENGANIYAKNLIHAIRSPTFD